MVSGNQPSPTDKEDQMNAINTAALLLNIDDCMNIEASADDIEIAPVEQLSFTVVPTYSVEEGRPDFEVHATGCKDLRKMQAAGVDSFEFRSVSGRQVVKDALVGGRAKQGFAPKNFQVCDCCSPVRMRAARRA